MVLFDQNRKPIFPLLSQPCILHSRMIAYNYIDARTDLSGALKQFVAEIERLEST